MRRAVRRERFSAFQVGLIAIVVIVVAVFLAFAKDIPFTQPYQLKAVFENAPPIQKGQAVIAGVDVGKVSGVEALGGDSPAVEVTMKLDDEALPIHEDAEVKVRPRIFSRATCSWTSGPVRRLPEADSAATRFRLLPDLRAGADRPGPRHAPDEHPQGPAEAARGLRRGHQRRAAAGRGRRPGGGGPGLTAAEALNKSLDYSADFATPRSSTRPCSARRPVTSRLIGSQQKVFAALSSRENQLKDLITNFNTHDGARWRPRRATCARQSPSCPKSWRQPTRPRQPQRRLPAHPRVRARDHPRRPRDAGHHRGRLPVDRQTRALLSKDELQGLVDVLPAVSDVRRRPGRSCRRSSTPSTAASSRSCCRPRSSASRTATSPPGCATTRSSSSRWCRSPASRRTSTATGRTSASRRAAHYQVQTRRGHPPLFANATLPPLGSRPARAPPPYKGNFACHKHRCPTSNACIGAGP